jgi:hypothetical protein
VQVFLLSAKFQTDGNSDLSAEFQIIKCSILPVLSKKGVYPVLSKHAELIANSIAGSLPIQSILFTPPLIPPGIRRNPGIPPEWTRNSRNSAGIRRNPAGMEQEWITNGPGMKIYYSGWIPPDSGCGMDLELVFESHFS